jgi:adenylate cyclase
MALSLYRDQKWDKALEAFKLADSKEDMFQGRHTNPSRLYIDRCEYFKENSPGSEWDGSWTLTAK